MYFIVIYLLVLILYKYRYKKINKETKLFFSGKYIGIISKWEIIVRSELNFCKYIWTI